MEATLVVVRDKTSAPVDKSQTAELNLRYQYKLKSANGKRHSKYHREGASAQS